MATATATATVSGSDKRSHGWFAAAFALLAVATLTPIWIARYLPLLDLPNHLSAIAIWHYHDDPKWDFAAHYSLNLVPLPYWAHYYTVHLLTYVTGSVEVANKLFLSAYALAVPAGALLFCRRFERSHWLALFTFPLVWNFNLADGFIAYCAGFAALPLALVLVDRHAERPSWRRAIIVAVAGTLTYFFHLLSYLLFLVCAGLLLLVQRRPLSPRLLLVRALPVLSCTAVGLWALRRANNMDFHRITHVPRAWVRDPVRLVLTQIPERMFSFLPGNLESQILLVLVAAWLGLAVTARWRARTVEGEPDRGRLHRWGVEVCALAALAAYLAAPRSMRQPFYWHMINVRFLVAFCFFAVLIIRGHITGWRRLFVVPLLAAHVLYMGALSRAFVQFNRNGAGMDELVAQVPRGAQVMTLILRPMGDATVNVSAFNQFPSYVQIHHGGYNHYNFAEGFPLKYRHYLPAPVWSHAEDFRWEYHATGWDYFLTFREGWEASPMSRPLAEGKVRLVDHQGVWKLYQKMIPDPPAPSPEPREP